MAPRVVFPDAAAVVINHLRTQLDVLGPAVTVSDRVPRDRPGTFVQVRRVGGPNDNLIADNALLAIECWAPQPEAAHDLAQWSWAIVRAMEGTTVAGVPVYRVQTASGPQDFPDPLSDQPRYSFTVSVAMRGTAL